MYQFSFLDIILTPVYIFLLISLGKRIESKNIDNDVSYQYFTKGLYFKFIGAIALCCVYLFYYGGGDTINYMGGTKVLMRLGTQNMSALFDILFNGMSREAYSQFNASTGYPEYSYAKPEEWRVIRFTFPASVLGLGLYIPASLIIAYFSYLGNFKLYQVFCYNFPGIYKKLAIPLLFIPSAVFWGSGILKDTFTFSAIGWYTYGFYMAFIRRENMRKNIITIIIASWLILSIKSYIFIALLPGSLIWLNFERLRSIKSTFIRTLAMPIVFGIVGGGGVFIMSQLGSSLGDRYSSVDKALQTAVVTQQDLKRSEYQGASFDIGNFDPTIGGVVSKMPVAIVAGLFRPFIWEARNPVMLISGLENLIFLGLTIRLLLATGFGFFTRIGKSPLLIFSLIFSLFFAFAVGLTTSNFGSLVRYKIPCEPFYLGLLYVLFYLKKEDFDTNKTEEDVALINEEEEEKDSYKRLRSKTGFIVK
ncbi:MAG: hypothetical protein M0D57_18345 [Sphingobacteriales bacterium JAD_PAG50586_3]|nr:MAG: hypothetical protein M0D57_18345 [Sphingobacteriales bacterium JAD_PAG50586_3]